MIFQQLKQILGNGNWVIDFSIDGDKLVWIMRSKVTAKSIIKPIIISGTAEQYDQEFISSLRSQIPEDVKFRISEASKMLNSLEEAVKKEKEAKDKKNKPASSTKKKEEVKKPSLF